MREASGRVNDALQEATRLRGLAQGAAVGDLGPWELAAGAAEKARDLLEPGVEPALRKQVEDLAAELAAERQQAEAAAQAADRDRTLLDRLVDIRSAEADDRGGWSTDAAYADAFREAGLDVAALSAEEAAKRIRARPPEVATALATAVDDWAAVRRDRRKDRAGAAALSALAGAADPDPWRIGLRGALDLPDQAARLEALRRLAKDRAVRDARARSASTCWAGPSRTRATRPGPRRCCGGPSSATPTTSGSTTTWPGRWKSWPGGTRRSATTRRPGRSAPRRPTSWPMRWDTRASGTRRSRSSRT